jgi:integrase
MVNTLVFTQTAVAKMASPKAGVDRYKDSKTPGLYLRVLPSGRKTFELVRHAGTRFVRQAIGTYPAMTVGQARQAAAELGVLMAKGADPAGARRKARAEMTVADLWDDMLERHLKPLRRGKTAHDYTLLWDKHIEPAIGKHRLAEVRRADVAALHSRVGRRAPFQANRCIAVIHKLFAHARRHLAYEGQNPADDIERFPEPARERYIEPTEVPAFLQAIKDDPDPDVRDFVLLLLFTGARKSNVLAIRREEVDMRRAVWTIPASKTKSHREYQVHLPPPAVAILAERMGRIEGDYLFPPKKSGGRWPHWKHAAPAWKRLLGRAGLKGIRMHDVRRTLASWAIAGGASLPVVGKALGHADPATTSVYARLSLDPIKAAMNKAVASLLDAGNAQPKALPE